MAFNGVRIPQTPFDFIVLAMKMGKDDIWVEHLMGIYISKNPHSTMKGCLQEFIYAAQVASNGHWMRKLTKRGAVDMNTQAPMTESTIRRFDML
jgi:hypothetical protein